VPSSATLLRDTRRRAGLTQRQLALRLGVSQAAIAKLERPGANPTIGTLAGALRATGHRLELTALPSGGGVDESLIRRQLELSPSERMHGLEAMYAQAQALAQAGARSHSEHT
jgi:transcriptional regulator with XRE-family HTH domain